MQAMRVVTVLLAVGAISALAADAGLGGTSWQLVRFQSSDDTVLTPDDPAKYTLAFGTDGRASVRADCNRGSGTWTSPGPSELSFGPLALTRALCPPGPLNARFARDFEFIRSYVRRDGKLHLALWADGGIYEYEPAAPAGPSFDCGKASATVEKLICADAELAALDRRLAAVYAEAEGKAGAPVPSWLRAEQRGWVKGRDDCWKAPEPRSCVQDEYQRRIVELQAKFRLVPFTGPVTFACTGASGGRDGEIIATFHQTEPPSALFERGDRTVFALLARTASGAKYEGANLTFWQKGGDAQVTWMDVELRCQAQSR